MKRIVLFGASGFLGSAILAALRPERFELHVADRQLDLTAEVDAIAKCLALAQPDVVINASGRVQGSETLLEQANLSAIKHLAAAMQLVCPTARLIHLGSGAEYGPGEHLHEDALAQPVSTYGQIKLRATEHLLSLDLPVTVLRVFNTIGPTCPKHLLPGAVAARLWQAQQSGTNELRTGPLSDVRSFIDVRDLARALLLVMKEPKPAQLINVGGLEAVPVRVLVETLIACAGFQGRLIEDPELASPRSSSVAKHSPDLTRLLGLGWRPALTLQQSVQDLWSSLRTS